MILLVLVLPAAFDESAYGQSRPSSPPGSAATVLGGEWSDGQRPSYQDGRWLEVTYNRPILRQRPQIFGDAENYGQAATAGAPVWRAGANQTTRFETEADLLIDGQTVPAGTYSLFVDLESPERWTLILSNWRAQKNLRPE